MRWGTEAMDRFAPIRLADPGHPAPTHFAPALLDFARAQPDHAAMDDIAAYAEELNDAIDDAIGIDLKLGLATVRVEYLLVAGCPLVQGATVNGEWTDADCFARHVTAGWRRDIEHARAREVAHG